jgi:hypothetical protein
MSSLPSHRLAISALALAMLLALAAPPAQASSLLDHLGAKVQTWLAAWLPGAGTQGEGTTDPNGRAVSHARLPAGHVIGSPDRHAGRSFHPGIKPACGTNNDPNGCP